MPQAEPRASAGVLEELAHQARRAHKRAEFANREAAKSLARLEEGLAKYGIQFVMEGSAGHGDHGT